MRSFDWSKTPVGAASTWPQSLRTALGILLDSGYPMYIAWGREFTQFYNDAYRPILGSKKHPAALGQGTPECFAEIWDFIGPMFNRVLDEGANTTLIDQHLGLDRSGYLEECYFTFSYSAIRGEGSGVGGVLVTVFETTERVIEERRQRTLRDLAAQALEARDAAEMLARASRSLAQNTHDLPFVLLYLANAEGRARLVARAGEQWGPEQIDLEDESAIWPLGAVARTGRAIRVDDLAERLGKVTGGAWPEPIKTAQITPIFDATQTRTAGFIVAGVNPRHRLDERYTAFFQAISGHLATGLVKANAYEEEKKRAEALAEIDRAKTAFFSNVSHEFRTPLTLMLGPLESVLAKASGLQPDVREQIETAHRNSLRLLKLVNSLLDFSRIEAGRVMAAYAPVDLAELTADLASNFRAALNAAGLELVVDCPALPQLVYVDREMWEKIVFNLLSNAFKFTFHGRVTVRLRARGNEAVLTVADTGVGIPAAELPRIFERFHRVESTRGRTYEGSGIGLALVQELVKLHDGRIDVSSRVNEGTAFTVEIPFGNAHLPQGRTGATERMIASTITQPDAFAGGALPWISHGHSPSPPVVAGPGLAEGRRFRILIADDNADMRDHIRRILGLDYYDIIAVADGRAALDAARDAMPDLILSDVMMPSLDGFELIRELRADAGLREVPVILLSARAGEEARTAGIAAGADDYLTKPFSSRELLARVQTTLKHQQLRRESHKEIERTNLLLQQRTQQYETLLDRAPIGVYLVDADFRIREVNPTARPVFGGLPDLIGRDFSDVLHILWAKEDADAVIQRFRHTLETGESYTAPEWIEDRLDRNITEYYEWRIDRIPLPDGRFGVVAYFRDISAQVLARVKIAESEEQLQSMVNTIDQLAWMARADGWIFWYNSRWYEYTGTTPAEMEGWGWQSVHHPQRLPNVMEKWIESIRTGEPFNMVFPLKGADGTFRPFLTRVNPVRDQKGEIVRWFGTNTDITEQREIQEQLQRANQDLEQFAYSASHDLQEPLRSVKIYSELLSERFRPQLEGQGLEFLDYVRNGATRMEMLIRDLLTYTQVATQDRPDESADANVAMKAALANLAGTISESGARISCDPLPALPVHDTHLQQLFQNLIGNAVKYRRPGVPPVVHISAQRQNASWCFDISDNGIGVEEEYRERIFGLFKRLHTGDEYSGTGIGLAICQRIVERYGGRIWVDSAPGKGSTFRFTLPG
ncbi:MAG: ATP-binding protein [Bryobacteraceae bacterium]